VIRTVIADDVPLARDRLARMLEPHSDIRLVGAAGSGTQACEMIAALAPELAILDIAMPDLDGIALARRLHGQGAPRILFQTAHPQHALPAFEVAALDYLLKPVSPERLAEALDRVRRSLAAEPPGLLAIPEGATAHFVSLDRIDHIESAGHYLCVHAGGTVHILREPLGDLAERLGADFLRIHRSAIVRLDRVMRLTERRNGDARLLLTSGATVPVSRTYRPLLDRLLAGRQPQPPGSRQPAHASRQ
jgi:two-component system LytT family response regulator